VHTCTRLYVWCPGCDQLHGIVVTGELPGDDTCWEWDRDEEHPTFSPSLLVTTKGYDGKPDTVCHSFIRNGVWEFLSDSFHVWKGKKHDMVDLPDWVGK